MRAAGIPETKGHAERAQREGCRTQETARSLQCLKTRLTNLKPGTEK